MRTIIALLCAISCAAVLVGGCSNSAGPSGSDYLEPTSPENVLLNLERAYGERDVDEYLACLSDDFKFHFTEEDQQGWPQFPPWFYKSDEQQVHENMFGDEWNVETIILTLTVASVETIPGGDLRVPGDIVVIVADADLRINFSGGVGYLATNPQEFLFRTVPGSEEREGRVLWEMFEWHDLEDWGDGSRVEAAGWGGIKYTFLDSLSVPSHRTSPAEVIDQLEAAYVAMDTMNYLDCLSEDFIFFPNEDDVNDPNQGIPSEWYKPDERTMHGNMFGGDSDVESIHLTLTISTIVYDQGIPDDPLDDTCVCEVDVDLRMNLLGGSGFLATSRSEFRLCVDQDEEGPYGETMWEVYEWYDLDDHWRGGASEDREQSSWGSIKAMYR